MWYADYSKNQYQRYKEVHYECSIRVEDEIKFSIHPYYVIKRAASRNSKPKFPDLDAIAYWVARKVEGELYLLYEGVKPGRYWLKGLREMIDRCIEIAKKNGYSTNEE